MEKCDCNLEEYIEQKGAKLTYDERINLFLKLCEGIQYIHHHKDVINIIIFAFFLYDLLY